MRIGKHIRRFAFAGAIGYKKTTRINRRGEPDVMQDRISEETPLLELKLKGLGPRSKEKLIEGGIATVGDLIGLRPRAYLDYSRITPIDAAPLDEPVHIRAKILSIDTKISYKKKLPILEALIDDGIGSLRVVWFNQPYLKSQLVQGETASFYGKIKMEKHGRTMTNPKLVTRAVPESEIKPVYRQIGGLRSDQIADWILSLVTLLPFDETLPRDLLEKYRFPDHKTALRLLHRPESGDMAVAMEKGTHPARRRLALDELVAFQRRLEALLQSAQQRDHPRLAVERTDLDRFLAALPFTLTGDQRKVIDAMVADLDEGRRLHGLIQGDVGCGKTVVGLAAAWLMARAGYQTALLCPTQILAEQHLRTARALLEPLGMRTVLSSAAQSGGETRQTLAALEAGEADLAVGTHRLFSKDVRFAKLGLVLIDEQHRFGVDQRAAMLKKGQTPHYLAFSATPIPRSLAMTLYADYQVYQIKEKPSGRQEVRTILKKESNREEVIAFALKRLAVAESVFWVFPLIEADEEEAARSATRMVETFRQGPFRDVAVGLAHGRMKTDEINATMAAFRSGEIRVLVATTVIEVGVDIPDASIMVIEGANRFGSSQLHQLRGRVGRAGGAAFCFLMVPSEIDRDGLRRMRFLEKTTDGFAIAEFDLEDRGAGELLGTRQSGLPEFRFGDPWRDRDLMEEARRVVRGS